MWLTKKQKGTSRRFARSVLAGLTLLMATLAGHSSPRGEELEAEEPSWRWTDTPEVREALSPAAETSPRERLLTGGGWIPLTGIEQRNRSIF
jgi:hypothetical protein